MIFPFSLSRNGKRIGTRSGGETKLNPLGGLNSWEEEKGTERSRGRGRDILLLFWNWIPTTAWFEEEDMTTSRDRWIGF